MFLLIVTVYLAAFTSFSYSQVELVSPSHSVYNYLQRMQSLKITPDYNPGNIPISRESVAGFLRLIESNIDKITSIDKKLLIDYKVEFEYELDL